MQVELQNGSSKAPLQVQRRERDKGGNPGNGVAYKFVDSRSDDESDNRNAGTLPTRRDRSCSQLLASGCKSCGDFVTNSPVRAFLIAAFFLSVLLLVLVTREGDGSSLCKEAAQDVTYPHVEFDRIKLRKDKARFAAVKAENWIVVLVTGPPTDAVRAMVRLQGWQVLAIGDSETPENWMVPDAVFLSNELQASFRYRVTSFVPYNSYVRKTIGYLFAIQHGAVRIYDADTQSTLMGGHLGRSFGIDTASKSTLLQFRSFKNRTLVNPFVHFGQRSVWPRGLSLTTIPKISPEVTYDEVSSDNQLIRQGLANGLPDVDAVFYHSRRLAGEPINIEFDHLAPPVALPQGTMAPINSINTLFLEPAFWALLLPVSVHSGVADIFRGYWSQRLLWEIGGKTAFYPPSIRRLDTMEGAVFDDEEDLLQDWEQLMDFLVSWRSSKGTFFEKILDLSYNMAKKGFWTKQDLELTVAWLKDLVSVGYKPPKLKGFELDDKRSGHHQKTVQFIPQVFKTVYPGVDDSSRVEKEVGHLIKWRNYFDNIVLILEVEWPLNHTVPAWRLLYGRLFKHVVVLSKEADPTLGVEGGGGWQAYTTFPGIFDRYPDAQGFLYAKEHAVLNYWNFVTANKSKLWTMHQEKDSWRTFSFNDTGEDWFLKSSIKRTVKKTIYNLPEKLKAIYRTTMNDSYFIQSTSDFFYIPQRFVGDFKDLASVGGQNKIAQELAMPVFLLAMDTPSQFDTRAFSQVVRVPWGQTPSDRYSIDLNVIYPWKATSEAELYHIIRSMSSGDHLLLAVL